MNYKLIVEVTFEELLKNYANAVKTELGRDVEVKCVDAPVSVDEVQSTEETTANTPVETPKKTPKKKTQAKKKETESSTGKTYAQIFKDVFGEDELTRL